MAPIAVLIADRLGRYVRGNPASNGVAEALVATVLAVGVFVWPTIHPHASGPDTLMMALTADLALAAWAVRRFSVTEAETSERIPYSRALFAGVAVALVLWLVAAALTAALGGLGGRELLLLLPTDLVAGVIAGILINGGARRLGRFPAGAMAVGFLAAGPVYGVLSIFAALVEEPGKELHGLALFGALLGLALVPGAPIGLIWKLRWQSVDVDDDAID